MHKTCSQEYYQFFFFSNKKLVFFNQNQNTVQATYFLFIIYLYFTHICWVLIKLFCMYTYLIASYYFQSFNHKAILFFFLNYRFSMPDFPSFSFLHPCIHISILYPSSEEAVYDLNHIIFNCPSLFFSGLGYSSSSSSSDLLLNYRSPVVINTIINLIFRPGFLIKNVLQ